MHVHETRRDHSPHFSYCDNSACTYNAVLQCAAHKGWQMYAGRVCARTQRTDAAARESLQQDRPVGLTLPVFHACGSANPFCARCCHSRRNQVVSTRRLRTFFHTVLHKRVHHRVHAIHCKELRSISTILAHIFVCAKHHFTRTLAMTAQYQH